MLPETHRPRAAAAVPVPAVTALLPAMSCCLSVLAAAVAACLLLARQREPAAEQQQAARASHRAAGGCTSVTGVWRATAGAIGPKVAPPVEEVVASRVCALPGRAQ